MKFFISKLLKLVLTVAIIAALSLYLYRNDYLSIFGELSPIFWFISIIWGWAIMQISSQILFAIRLKHKVPVWDYLLFPVAQSLWGYLIPIQGSSLFSVLYFKRLHNVSVSKTLSVNLLFITLAVFFTGLIGLFILVKNNLVHTTGLVFFSLLIILPLTLFMFKNLNINKDQSVLLHIPKTLIQDIFQAFATLLQQKYIILLYCLKIILSASWYFFIAVQIGANTTFLSILMLYFFLEAVVIFKLTPGNWGIQQLAGAFIFSLIALSADSAILITTIALLSIILLNLTIGLFANYYFLKRLNLTSLSSFYKHIQND